jgi:hypothetical protein
MTTNVEAKKSARRVHEAGLKIWGMNQPQTNGPLENVGIGPQTYAVHHPYLNDLNAR